MIFSPSWSVSDRYLPSAGLAMPVHSFIERSPLCGLVGCIFADNQILLPLCSTFASPFLIYFIKNCSFALHVSYYWCPLNLFKSYKK